MKEGNIHIGRDVWIGCRAMILPGVTLGAGCVVAAGAIVTKSFPANSVLVGAPARLLRTRSYSSSTEDVDQRNIARDRREAVRRRRS